MNERKVRFKDINGKWASLTTVFTPDDKSVMFISGHGIGCVYVDKVSIDYRNTHAAKFITITGRHLSAPVMVSTEYIPAVSDWAKFYATPHLNEHGYPETETDLECRMEGMPVITESKDCELCGCIISAEHTYCDTCKMLDTLEDDLTDIKTEQVTRIDLKYRVGAKEHGGRGWEMGTGKLIENAQDEVADLTCYLHWLSGHYETILELSQNANAAFAAGRPEDAEREVAALMKVLDGRPDRG